MARGISWKDKERFLQNELFTHHPISRSSIGNTSWAGDFGLHGAVAVLNGGGKTGASFTAGPDFAFHSPWQRVSLMGGVGLTLLTRTVYRDQDFGGIVQFSSYVGIGLQLPLNLDVTFRLQHVSNAGLFKSNSGINMNLLQINRSL
ncbi:MAG: acyloxyacyl hydrolase [Candidatus Latescibacterota bacterium]